MEEEPIPCHIGFHFCKTIAETYRFYPISDDTRICKVEALGEVRTDDGIKYCTNSIRIVEEITEDWKRKGNSSASNSGYCNSGDCNSGNYNSGNYNSGYYNSGYCNSGYCNSGNYNSGVFNTEQNPKLKMFDKESNWTFND